MDKELKCKDCNTGFVFTIGEQEFYKDRGFQEPKRCKECAGKRRNQFSDSQNIYK